MSHPVFTQTAADGGKSTNTKNTVRIKSTAFKIILKSINQENVCRKPDMVISRLHACKESSETAVRKLKTGNTTNWHAICVTVQTF